MACQIRLVHRLDRNTSGAILVARSADGASWLSRALRQPAEAMQRGRTGADGSGNGSPTSGDNPRQDSLARSSVPARLTKHVRHQTPALHG